MRWPSFERGTMATFLYRCPNTGQEVQGFVADGDLDASEFEAIACTACRQLHWVSPKTGQVLGRTMNNCDTPE